MKGLLNTVIGGDVFDFVNHQFLRNIYLLCIVALFIVPFYLHLFVKPRVERNIVRMLQVFSVDSAKHLNNSFKTSVNFRVNQFNIDSMDEQIKDFKTDFSIVKVKVFNTEGFCVYSTKRDEISLTEKNIKPYFLNEVKTGKTYSKVVNKNQESKDGKIVSVNSDVLETYYPIMDNGNFLGAIEIYYDITEYVKEIEHEEFVQFATLSAVYGPFVVFFFFLFFRESKNQKIKNEQEKLLKEEHYKRLAIENSVMIGILTLNTRCRITYANPAFIFMTGYSEEELYEMELPFGFFQENENEMMSSIFTKIAHGDIPPNGFESRFATRSGWTFVAKYSVAPIRDEEDKVKEWVISFNDISDYHELLKEKENMSERLMRVVEMNELLRTCKNVEDAFRIACRYLGIIFNDFNGMIASVEDSTGILKMNNIWGEITLANVKPHCEDCFALRTGKAQYIENPEENLCKGVMIEHNCINYMCIPLKTSEKDIGLVYIQPKHRVSYYLNQQKEFILNVVEQVSSSLSNVILNEKLRNQAIRDRLTGLYNRHFMDEISYKEFERARRNHNDLTVMMIDIDHFKDVNDTYGHSYGDYILSSIGNILLRKFRDAGTDIVCRYGGEEMLILMPGCNMDNALIKAEMIRKYIETKEFSYNEQKIKITVSIGVGEYTDRDISCEAFIDKADKALYDAKETGRNIVCS